MLVGVSDGVDGGDTGRLNAFSADLTNCSKRSTLDCRPKGKQLVFIFANNY